MTVKRGDTHRGSTISLPLTGQSDLGPPGNRLSSSTLVDFTNGNGLHKAYSQDNCLDLDDFTMPNLMVHLTYLKFFATKHAY